jgi:hypothetical protein
MEYVKIFPFHNILLNLWKNSQKKKKKACHDICIWKFPISLSHFGGIVWIYLFIYLFLCMMGASKTIFWEGSFVFSFIKL